MASFDTNFYLWCTDKCTLPDQCLYQLFAQWKTLALLLRNGPHFEHSCRKIMHYLEITFSFAYFQIVCNYIVTEMKRSTLLVFNDTFTFHQKLCEDAPLTRRTPSHYADGVYAPSGGDRPNPREISEKTMKGYTGSGSQGKKTALLVFFGTYNVRSLFIVEWLADKLDSGT